MGRNVATGARPTAAGRRHLSKLQSIGTDFNDLVDTLIRWDIEVILFRNGRRDESGPGG